MRQATCQCGAVKIALEGEPVRVRTCWCRDCQYWGGGTATVNAAYARSQVDVTGDVSWVDGVADSGNAMRRGFCPVCGTPLFTSGDATPDWIGIRVGVLDDPSSVTPTETIWTSSAPDWAVFDPGLPQSDRQ